MKRKKFITVLGILCMVLGTGCGQKNYSEIDPAQLTETAEKQSSGINEELAVEKTVKEEQRVEEKPAEQQPEHETVPSLPTQEIDNYLQAMTLEEKVAQLFIVVPEALVESADGAAADTVTAAGERTKAALSEYPVGGFIYMGKNLISTEQTTEMLHNVQDFSMELTGLPLFLCVDEEGGTVARISGKEGFAIPAIEDMAEIGSAAGEENLSTDLEAAREKAYETGAYIGAYLKDLGFNLDFAPVADVWSNPENTVVKRRSFGSDPELVSELALAVSDGLNSQGVYSTFKHFPGHGATAGDTHEGYAYTEKTLEELRECELVPFQAAIDAGADFIMAGHISLPGILGDVTPASLSYEMLTGVLREEMGYDGMIVTDALNMGAIAEHYTPAEAAVKALQAGADLILMPEDFKAAYQGVLDAAESGQLSQERIDASVKRILEYKINFGRDHSAGDSLKQ